MKWPFIVLIVPVAALTQVTFPRETGKFDRIDTKGLTVSAGSSATYDYSELASKVRLKLKVRGQEGLEPASIEMEDKSGKTIQTIALRPASEWIWTGMLTSTGIIHLIAHGGSITVVEALAIVSPGQPQGIIGQDHRVWSRNESDRIRALGRAVARLYIPSESGGATNCTGFLISPLLIMTNAHCFANSRTTDGTVIEFDYDYDSSLPPPHYSSKALLLDPTLDVAILVLTDRVCDRTSFRLSTFGDLTKGQDLIVIGHPEGEPKQVSKVGCYITNPHVSGSAGVDTEFEHHCATEPGSSGSPVIDFYSGEVIGLHHMGDDGVTHKKLNQAVKMALIKPLVQKYLADSLSCHDGDTVVQRP